MDKLKIEYVDINSIKPYKNNAKLHPKEQIEQIKKSIEQFGMDDPIMNSDFDLDILNDELDDILNIDMSDFGFDLDLEDEEEKEIIEDEVPEVPEEPKAKLGDIYQLGSHRLMCRR